MLPELLFHRERSNVHAGFGPKCCDWYGPNLINEQTAHRQPKIHARPNRRRDSSADARARRSPSPLLAVQ